jgi:hypothetical protein
MDQPLRLHTRRTFSAGIGCIPLRPLTHNILSKSQRHRQGAAALMPQEKKGMTKPVLPDHLDQILSHLILTYNFRKLHGRKYNQKHPLLDTRRRKKAGPKMAGRDAQL